MSVSKINLENIVKEAETMDNKTLAKIYVYLSEKTSFNWYTINNCTGIQMKDGDNTITVFYSIKNKLTVQSSKDTAAKEIWIKFIEGFLDQIKVGQITNNTTSIKEEVAEELNDVVVDATYYTDGSWSSKNPLEAGYAFTCSDGTELNGVKKNPLSRQIDGELNAVIFALKDAINKQYKSIEIVSDLTGAMGWATGWKTNEEITKKYKEIYTKLVTENKIKVTFRIVKGHTGDHLNERADKLAKEAIGIA